jgi:methylated-DNA-[protein]-cysteine S-methyltransferase
MSYAVFEPHPGDKSVTSAIDYAAVVPAPVGLLGIRMSGGQLLGIDFAPQSKPIAAAPNGAAREVLDQLFHYFEDSAWQFNLPLAMHGTPFQRRVWQALRRIPSGSTCSYGEIAREIRSSARAVGGACRRNPIPIVVPCHRVIAAGGGAGGFMGQRGGDALAIKTWLLDHERRRS